MLTSIAHRGPDGKGTWVKGPIGLGHLMLHTTPESFFEELPFRDENNNLTITADARIDNRDELISTLSLNGFPKGNVTDIDDNSSRL